MPSVLLDTGPLIALFKRNDAHHALAVDWFKRHTGRLLTTHAVITEAWHLVRDPARLPLMRFVAAACDVSDLGPDGTSRILAALERFADFPMDYADASLIVLADIERVFSVATVDLDEFSAYRTASGKTLKNTFKMV